MESNVATIIPIKCALKYKPPMLILVYKDDTSGKLRRRSMPLRGFTLTTEIPLYIEKLKLSRNKVYINSIPETQLSSLLNRVKCAQQLSEEDRSHHQSLSSLQDLPSLPEICTQQRNSLSIKLDLDNEVLAPTKLTKPITLDEKFNHALNALLSDEDDAKPMHQTKEKRVSVDKSPTDQYKYNDAAVKVTTESWKERGGENVSAETPDYSADFNSESDKIGGNMLLEGKFDQDDDNSSPIEELEDEEIENVEAETSRSDSKGNVHKEEDLNKVTEDELEERKAEMDILFEANRIKPGDEGYEYDREVEFGGAKIESGWDSASSDLEF